MCELRKSLNPTAFQFPTMLYYNGAQPLLRGPQVLPQIYIFLNIFIVQPWWLGLLARYLSHSVEEVHLAIGGSNPALGMVMKTLLI